jgi:hypothetical protein
VVALLNPLDRRRYRQGDIVNTATDFGEDNELFLENIEAEQATRLVRGDMRHLVSLRVISGMDIPGFPPSPRQVLTTTERAFALDCVRAALWRASSGLGLTEPRGLW